jgi:hypothetical protein
MRASFPGSSFDVRALPFVMSLTSAMHTFQRVGAFVALQSILLFLAILAVGAVAVVCGMYRFIREHSRTTTVPRYVTPYPAFVMQNTPVARGVEEYEAEQLIEPLLDLIEFDREERSRYRA